MFGHLVWALLSTALVFTLLGMVGIIIILCERLLVMMVLSSSYYVNTSQIMTIQVHSDATHTLTGLQSQIFNVTGENVWLGLGTLLEKVDCCC